MVKLTKTFDGIFNSRETLIVYTVTTSGGVFLSIEYEKFWPLFARFGYFFSREFAHSCCMLFPSLKVWYLNVFEHVFQRDKYGQVGNQ